MSHGISHGNAETQKSTHISDLSRTTSPSLATWTAPHAELWLKKTPLTNRTMSPRQKKPETLPHDVLEGTDPGGSSQKVLHVPNPWISLPSGND
jgi:hypothetical protein